MKIYGIVGWKNTGKTTLMERLVSEITARGFSVSTVKHAHHTFDVDHPGKDSFRHRAAGAREVMLASKNRWALMHEAHGEPEATLHDLLARLSPVDLVLIEGYKRDAHAKIEVHRREAGQSLLAQGDDTVKAIAANIPVTLADMPVFDLNDIVEIADFILQEVGLD
ncbi:MAG: molybdopterin-guanine dinucleotide biosynthesis protein B [Paracoccaceae bacterium]